MTFKTIFMAVGTAEADAEIDRAVTLCEAAGAHLALLVVGIAPPPPASPYGVVSNDIWAGEIRDGQNEAQVRGKELEARLAAGPVPVSIEAQYIDRGTVADTAIGDGTKIDNLVQLGHNVKVGRTCLICGHVAVGGSTVIGDRVVLASMLDADDDAASAAASYAGELGTEGILRLIGEGAFSVWEFAVTDLAVTLELSEHAARAYVAQAVELRDRLPRLWGQVMTGRLPVWKARRVAEQTIHLKAATATFVDDQGRSFLCGAIGTADECLLECVEGACPDGYGCGADGTCRQASGVFERVAPLTLAVDDVATGDVDGDGFDDLVASSGSSVMVGFGSTGADLAATQAELIKLVPIFLAASSPARDAWCATHHG